MIKDNISKNNNSIYLEKFMNNKFSSLDKQLKINNLQMNDSNVINSNIHTIPNNNSDGEDEYQSAGSSINEYQPSNLIDDEKGKKSQEDTAQIEPKFTVTHNTNSIINFDSYINLIKIKIFKDYVSQQTKKQAGKALPISAILGYCVGQYLRKFSKKWYKTTVFQGGGMFLFLQALHAGGQLKLNYKKIENDAKDLLDTDGDGEITINDRVVFYKKLVNQYADKSPYQAAFLAAFAYGLSKDIDPQSQFNHSLIDQ